MENKLTQSEIEKRFAQIDALEPEVLSAEEAASLAAAEAMDDGSTVSLEELRREEQLPSEKAHAYKPLLHARKR